MQKRQTVLGSHHRWHLLTSSIFAAVMVSLLSACGTSNTGGRSTTTPTATQTLAHLTVYAFKATDGTLLWSAQGYNPVTGPLVADGKVFVDSYTNEPDGSVTISVAALKGTDGSQLWSKQVVTHSTLAPPTPGTFWQMVANGVFYTAVLSALATDPRPAHFLLYAFD